MIIDCHGHYTSLPAAHRYFREQQHAWLAGGTSGPPPTADSVSDDELRETVEPNQLRVLRERGADLMVLSPQASLMEHHVPDPAVAIAWARASNDLVGRVAKLYPDHFAPAAQLPQTPDGDLAAGVVELRRCVEKMGFVGVNINPDPSGGRWSAPPMTDPFWFPLYEAMVELDVPGMVHVSTSCIPAVQTLGAHYLAADTTVFVQLMMGDLFQRFPTLRLVIPHGGGAVPYHWGRYRGLATRFDWQDPAGLLNNVFFDTCVYHQDGINLLFEVVPLENLLFASEMLGAVRGTNPSTGSTWDDTKRYVDALDLSLSQREQIFAGNARRVFPRLTSWLGESPASTG